MDPMEGNQQGQAPASYDDWLLEGAGDSGDPNANICESCQ